MFPSTLTTFSYPTPSDRLNNPSHSSLHNTVSSALGQVETIIGTDASTLGTIIGDLRSASSDGGGHVQSAVKGGTGQVSFTKGDVLVAQNASTLTKLAVGSDGQSLIANSSTVTGVNWAIPGGSKVLVNPSIFTISETAQVGEVSVVSALVPGSTLGISNAVRATAFININRMAGSVVARARFGSNSYASVMLRTVSNSVVGTITTTLMGNGNTGLQRGILQVNLAPYNNTGAVGSASTSIVTMYDMNTASVNSSANQSLGLTLMGSDTVIVVNGSTVEKIV